MEIRPDDLSNPATRSLLRLHLEGMHASSPPGHVFALDYSGLKAPDVTLWSAWEGDEICGIGALRQIDAQSAEVKSMRTHPSHLGRGVGRALLEHIIAEAQRRGIRRLSLETGSGPAFDAAIALYRNRGFISGEPFADYAKSEFSQFFHLDLESPPTIVRCKRSDASEILAILNEAIVNTTAVYDYEPRTAEAMERWFDAKEKADYPVIGVKGYKGDLLAFGSYGQFRLWPAYKYTVEHSVYVRTDQRRRGLGKTILERLIHEASAQDYHAMIGAIDSANTISIALHLQLGFVPCGILPQVGFKFGRWLDLTFYQKLLPGPSSPRDG